MATLTQARRIRANHHFIAQLNRAQKDFQSGLIHIDTATRHRLSDTSVIVCAMDGKAVPAKLAVVSINETVGRCSQPVQG